MSKSRTSTCKTNPLLLFCILKHQHPSLRAHGVPGADLVIFKGFLQVTPKMFAYFLTRSYLLGHFLSSLVSVHKFTLVELEDDHAVIALSR
ncbi:hypothetical protein BT63DRAFT_429881 [Microthyrium microscopicum]|uniref:Uncharacterized protein n=1 Tax=Microthyrium microscopicum TaxID=703497 RepID=A0A6A6TWG4_9PEZI|nr:hypothetical protein BT63DRAFT_429881 [Microthyrium microscopicum]